MTDPEYSGIDRLVAEALRPDTQLRHLFPIVSVARAPLTFGPRHLDEADAYLQRMIDRQTRALLERHQDAINAAFLTALTDGWDLHLHRPTLELGAPLARLGYLGIEFAPRTERGRAYPVIHEHDEDWRWDD